MKKFKPTSKGRRQMTVVDMKHLSKDGPLKSLTKKLKKHSGRNNAGRITMRHQGGGHKKIYRMIDFKQQKYDILAKVEGIEYDPYRTAFIARIVYLTGERSYILASQGLKAGDKIIISTKAPLEKGNRMPLKNVPIGYEVFNIEMQPGKGGELARSAGSYAEVSAHEGKFTNLKLPSGEVRKVLTESYATIGRVSNPENNLVSIGKAGRSRWMGIRPTVRGSAMNPVDHPYGGGEGRTQRGTKRPKDKWGNITGGRKTRSKKNPSNKLIISRRKNKRR